MTQTPASGPLALVTTPPISSLSMATDVLCWLTSWPGHEAREPTMPATTTLKTTHLLVLMYRSFLSDSDFFERHSATKRIGRDFRCRRVSKNGGLCQCELRAVAGHAKSIFLCSVRDALSLLSSPRAPEAASLDQLLNDRCRYNRFRSWVL